MSTKPKTKSSSIVKKVPNASDVDGDDDNSITFQSNETVSKPKSEYIIAWLDSTPGYDHNKSQLQDSLQDIFPTVEMFFEFEQLKHFLHENKTQRVILITSGRLGEKHIPDIHDHPLINWIYIFCMEPERYERMRSDYKKIRGVYTLPEDLCRELSFIDKIV